MKHNYQFCQNKACEYFPCHDSLKEDIFNCLFCFCPLYPFTDCGGKFIILDDGTKDCSACTLPHIKDNYNYVINKLIDKRNKK